MDKKTEKKPSDLKRLFSYAGNFRFLTVASIILSAVSAVMARAPFLKDSPIILSWTRRPLRSMPKTRQ